MEKCDILSERTLTNAEIKAKLVFIEHATKIIYQNGATVFNDILNELKASGTDIGSISFFASVVNDYSEHQRRIRSKGIEDKLDKIVKDAMANDPELKDLNVIHRHIGGNLTEDIDKFLSSLIDK